MPAPNELSPDQKGASSSEIPPWENLPRIDFSFEEAEACLSAFETLRKVVDEEIHMATWEKIYFFLLKAQAQGILGFPRGLDQKKTTGLALRYLPLGEQDSHGNFRYAQFRGIVDWAIEEGKITETVWDNYRRRKGKFILKEIGGILGVSGGRVRQWEWYGERALKYPSRVQKLHDHCLEVARSEEWEKITKQREESKIRDIRSLREFLSPGFLHALLRGNISTIPQALSLSEEELQTIRYIGPVGIKEVREALKQYLEKLPIEVQTKLKAEAFNLLKSRKSRK